MTEKTNPKRILVTGSSGFLGRAVVNLLNEKTNHVVLETRSNQPDLTILDDCLQVTKDIDLIINLAGLIPSRIEQRQRPAEVFRLNTLININIAEAARLNGVERIIFVSSVAAYPENAAIPLTEDNLWCGPVTDGNYAYGTAKRLTETIARAYRDQYKMESAVIFLPNLYGPNDKFDNNPPPLIPSIIKQVQAAITDKSPTIHGGNNGDVELDLLYVTDAASAILSAVEQKDVPALINISTGTTIAIKDVYAMVAKELGYEGTITWEPSSPTPPRIMDTKLATTHLDWKSVVPFYSGIENTIKEYLK